MNNMIKVIYTSRSPIANRQSPIANRQSPTANFTLEGLLYKKSVNIHINFIYLYKNINFYNYAYSLGINNFNIKN